MNCIGEAKCANGCHFCIICHSCEKKKSGDEKYTFCDGCGFIKCSKCVTDCKNPECKRMDMCTDCVMKCIQCSEDVCIDCSVFCESCGKLRLCEKKCSRNCEMCKSEYCDDCVIPTSTGLYCKQCITKSKKMEEKKDSPKNMQID